MSEESKSSGDLADEFRRLGDNFKGALRTAWQSAEWVDLTNEIRTGLNALGNSLNEAVDEIVDSPTSQRLRADLDEFADRVRSGHMTAELRQELLEVMQKVNLELENTLNKWRAPPEDSESAGQE